MDGSMQQEKDADLIRAFLGGDEAAFDALVLAYQDRVYTLCRRLLGDREEARDSAQETFVKVYRALGGFRFDAAFSTWLYTIAVNTCKNKLKSHEYRWWKRRLRLDWDSGSGGESPHREPRDPAPSALARLIQRGDEMRVQKAMDRLPAESRAVLVLRHAEGLSYEDIVRITGLNLGTVKSRLARARQQLQEKLKES
ncbi:MAG TPA: sigma-70 family RNA polymerase sigma factor [Syntrophobacteraceae bacterium]|nr:sigma-70 family RNA polymerase sigma factor [Syntrophobacteraceae bacterium]